VGLRADQAGVAAVVRCSRDGCAEPGTRDTRGVRVGIAHHLGWAVAVTASAGHQVVDRRRMELIEPGMPAAPIEHEAKALSDDAAARMAGQVRASALRAASASLDRLTASLPGPIVSMSLRAWPLDFPDDVAVQRRPPYDSGPTRSCTARCSRSAPTCAAGTFTCSTPGPSRRGRPGSSVHEPAMYFTCRGQRWDRPGPGTTGSRSPPRSLPADPLS